MPMITLTLPTGVVDATDREALRRQLASTLLTWEGAPNTEFFRAQAWAQIIEAASEDFGALGDDAPRFRVDVTVPQGALSPRRKAGLVGEVSEHVLAAAGLDSEALLAVWVLIHEQPEGTWGAGGQIIRFADLAAAAKAQADA